MAVAAVDDDVEVTSDCEREKIATDGLHFVNPVPIAEGLYGTRPQRSERSW